MVDKINVIAHGYVLTVFKVVVSSVNMITVMIYALISYLHRYASIHLVFPMSAIIAQKQRDDNVSSWKEGPKKSNAEMKTIVDAFEKGIKQNFSPDIVIHNNQLDISVSTACRYIHFHHMGAIINVDLKRQVKYKTRSSNKHVVIPINYDWLEGRRYEDYLERIENEDVSINIWQMDTILGKQGNEEKCVLSLLHTRSNLQLYFLLKEKRMTIEC